MLFTTYNTDAHHNIFDTDVLQGDAELTMIARDVYDNPLGGDTRAGLWGLATAAYLPSEYIGVDICGGNAITDAATFYNHSVPATGGSSGELSLEKCEENPALSGQRGAFPSDLTTCGGMGQWLASNGCVFVSFFVG
jgi:hypothetical protein